MVCKPDCPNQMWVEAYNDVQCWMVLNGLWEKYMARGKEGDTLHADCKPGIDRPGRNQRTTRSSQDSGVTVGPSL